MLMQDILKQRREPDANGCMNWLRAKGKDGYGHIYYEGKHCRAHRVIWQHFNGSIPTGLFVCHTCDNPLCCNEKHLFLGTPLDNSRDMVEKGRQIKGSQQPNTSLTEGQVIEMRKAYADGTPLSELAEIYPTSRSGIGHIVMGRRWKYVPFAVSQAHKIPVPDGEVRQIRAMYRLGLSFGEIAKCLGRSKKTVYRIATIRNYASVPD